jgi:hypothetical protein
MRGDEVRVECYGQFEDTSPHSRMKDILILDELQRRFTVMQLVDAPSMARPYIEAAEERRPR